MAAVYSAIEIFRLDVGRYPNKQEGLTILVDPTSDRVGWNGPYLKEKDILDAWGMPFIYTLGDGIERPFIYSCGPNGQDDDGLGDDVVCGNTCGSTSTQSNTI